MKTTSNIERMVLDLIEWTDFTFDLSEMARFTGHRWKSPGNSGRNIDFKQNLSNCATNIEFIIKYCRLSGNIFFVAIAVLIFKLNINNIAGRISHKMTGYESNSFNHYRSF